MMVHIGHFMQTLLCVLCVSVPCCVHLSEVHKTCSAMSLQLLVIMSVRDGNIIREMAALPLAEDIPIAFNSCRKGPRGLDWRDDKPAEIYWAECQVKTE